MKQRRDIQVRQGGVNFIHDVPMNKSQQMMSPFIAEVIAVYSERMSCNLKTTDGQKLYNIPVMTEAGMIGNEVYGTFEIPAVGDYVIVMYAAYSNSHKVIVGTFVPYLSPEFNSDAVNSGSKSYTLKLLEADKPLEYRKIFKSGTTIHVETDGSFTLETPSGMYIKIDETAGTTTIEDSHGNIIDMASTGITIDDANGNNVTMGAASVTINGNLEVLQ